MPTSKILFLAASPSEMSRLALDEESRAIGKKLRASERRDALELVTRWAVRPDDLLDYLNEFQPQVVHFSGHGTEEQQIVLVNNAGAAVAVSPRAIRQLFKAFKEYVRVVVLNACFSRAQAEAIVEEVDCAIGMTKEIGDQAAIAFSAAFYSAVGYGRSVRHAFEQGRIALELEGIPEESTPTLLVRAGVDPDQLFLVAARASAVAESSPVQRSAPPERPPPAAFDAAPAAGAVGSPTLATVLPGRWQIQIQMGFTTARMMIEMAPMQEFRGELAGPMGGGLVAGMWQADPLTGRIELRGQITDGMQVRPYAVLIQTHAVQAQQIVGVTTAGERVTWQRIG